jgi:small subunit ribosomal protein S20
MANTTSAKKALRSSDRKAVMNLIVRRAYKEASKEVKKLVLKKDKKASEALSLAYKQIDKAAKSNVIHKNTAARYKSNLAKSLKKLD